MRLLRTSPMTFRNLSTRSTTLVVSTQPWAISARNSSKIVIPGRRSNQQPDPRPPQGAYSTWQRARSGPSYAVRLKVLSSGKCFRVWGEKNSRVSPRPVGPELRGASESFEFRKMFSGFAVPASSASRSRSPPRSIAPRAAVHRPRQGAARQPLRRPHPGDRHSGDRDADRRKPCPVVADRGYRGHNAQPDHKFKVYISGQRRRVTETIKRELRRRSAVEPVIGHAKTEHRMARNYLAGTHGDAANAVLAAAGYNFRRLLEWLALLLSIILAALTAATSQDSIPKSA